MIGLRALAGATVAAVVGVAVWRETLARERGSRGPDLLDADEVRELYDRVAPAYDLVVSMYGLLGGRRLARRAIAMLDLRPGDTVVDLGCGTGVHLPGLADAVGAGGRVLGVDLSREMLDRARVRVGPRARTTIELVQEDIRTFTMPDNVRAVLATFALEMVPEYDDVIQRACDKLSRNGGRIAVFGLRRPDGWPEWAIGLGVALNKPFGVSRAYESLRPWQAVRRHAREVWYETTLLGAVYVSVGEPSA